MAVTIVGTAVHANAAGNADTITIPTGVAAGDGLVLFLAYASSAITTTLTDNGLSAPLTQVGAAATMAGHQSQVWTLPNMTTGDAGKVITSTLSTAARQVAVLVVYRGVARTGLVNAQASKTATVSTTTPTIPTVTATTPGCVEIALVSPWRGSTAPQIATVTAPTGSTVGPIDADPPVATATTSGGSHLAFEGHNLTPAAANATLGGDAYTLDVAAPYSAWTLALAPASTTTVDAGATQTVTAGATVTLAGTESVTTGATVASRTWTALTYPGTAAPTLAGATTATATFTAAAGEYTFRYRVTDSAGNTVDDTTTVYARAVGEARPFATPSAGEWTAVGAASIHAALSDEVATTYAETGDNPQGATFVVDLAPTDVGGKTINYTLANSNGVPTGTVLVEYLSAGRVVASWNETLTGTAALTQSRVLTDAQNALVTDPLNHQLRVTGDV